ncbi:MAG: GNAT family N-acetyltransferase, partial [Myxococcales bacterium]|nr:GNAT family N-acetyltransferase [Myxococcales bacterium]
MEPWHFGDTYREDVRLRDGTEVVLRPIRADDKAKLLEGFARLSPDARYMRFHGVKTALTDDELRYLTELDGVRHFALGAVRRDPDGEERGVGVARYVQLDGEPGVAEAAITVVDDMQGKGLGGLLFMRLCAAAAERGVQRFRCEVLGSNNVMQDLLRHLGTAAKAHVEAGVVTIELGLPGVPADHPPAEPPRESPMYQLLQLAAKGVLQLRDAVSRLLPHGDADDDAGGGGRP